MISRPCLLLLIFFSLCCPLYASNQSELKRENGILSVEERDHTDIRLALAIHEDWIGIGDREHLVCKYLNRRIPMDELMNQFGIVKEDLEAITDENRAKYNHTSKFFEACNYIGAYYIFSWGDEDNKVLEWSGADAFIDTQYSLLLVQFLDENRKEVRALFINKEHQFYSNEKPSIWQDIKRLFE